MPDEAPVAVATAVGEHQAQRQEHQHAQQDLLVGQRDEVPAFLIKIGESGNAKKGPHGSKASLVAPIKVESLFPVEGFGCSLFSPSRCRTNRSTGHLAKSQ